MMAKAAKEEAALGPPPKMDIPESVDDYIGMQRKMSRQEMPGSTQMQTTAGTLSAFSQMGQGASAEAGVLGAMMNRRNALSQMGIAAAQYTSGRQDQYAQAVASRAPWEQSQWEHNEWAPWGIRKNELMGDRNVGMNLKYQGMDEGAASFTQGMGALNRGIGAFANNPQAQNWWGGLGGGGGGINSIGPQMPFNTGRPSYNPYQPQYQNNLGSFLSGQ